MSNSLTLNYCLTCAGSGIKGGRLSGKKKCPVCKGTKVRPVQVPPQYGSTTLDIQEDNDLRQRNGK